MLTPSRPSTPDRPAERVVREVCEALGLDATVVNARHAIQDATSTAAALLGREPRPNAVFCLSDSIACGVYAAASALGLVIPDDLSVVGFDGIEAAAWMRPPLTTVEQPIDEIARTAIEALQALVDGPAQRLPSYVFRPMLRVGGTTAAPPAAG